MRIEKVLNNKENKNDYYFITNQGSELTYNEFKILDNKLRKNLNVKRIRKVNGIFSFFWEYLILDSHIFLIYDDSYGVFITAEKKEDEPLLELIIEKLLRDPTHK